MAKRVFVDMDGVLCNFRKKFIERWDKKFQYPQVEYGFWRELEEMPRAIEGINWLKNRGYDTWILTRPSYSVPMCYTEKRLWVEDHLGTKWTERLILSPRKDFFIGDYLIDDREWPDFMGYQLVFGEDDYPDWSSVINFFKKEEVE